jgi:hypothetical protein
VGEGDTRMQKLRLQQRHLYDWYEHDVAADDKIEVRLLRPRERDRRVLTPQHAWFELLDSAIGCLERTVWASFPNQEDSCLLLDH